MPLLRPKVNPINPVRMIVTSFAAVILAGTLLLLTPMATRAGNSTSITDAFFTAVSATCVTGLTIYDTYLHWTVFGQLVILFMVQVGGLGIVTFVTFFNILLGKRMALSSMQMAMESFRSGSFTDSGKLIRNVVGFSIGAELIGAGLLMIAFVPEYGASGIFMAVFTSVSAFCNAGFDLMGREGAHSSLTHFGGDPLVLLTVSALVICGGLGFLVWNDLAAWRKTRKLTFHTRLVLFTTGLMLAVGFLFFLLFESGNPRTLGDLPAGERTLNAFFQSVTLRTAGFVTLDFNSLYGVTKLCSVIWMFIGGGSGGTAGGIKLTTFAVIVMAVVSVVRNKEDTEIFGRRIRKGTVYKSLAILVLSLGMVGFAGCAVYFLDGGLVSSRITGLNALFETVAAFSTTGISVGVSEDSGMISRLLLAFTMFVGRIGPMTFALSLTIRANTSTKGTILPEGSLLVG